MSEIKKILSAKPTPQGGKLIIMRMPDGWNARIEFDQYGKTVGCECEPRVPQRKPYPMPDDFDPDQEARRMKQGGCCGKASE